MAQLGSAAKLCWHQMCLFDILTSLLSAKCLLGKTGGLDWLFRKSFKELKTLEGEPNPKTEAGSGLLAGFCSSSTNDFPLPFHSILVVSWGVAEPPKPQCCICRMPQRRQE